MVIALELYIKKHHINKRDGFKGCSPGKLPQGAKHRKNKACEDMQQGGARQVYP